MITFRFELRPSPYRINAPESKMGHSQLRFVITMPCLPRSASPTTRCERYQSEDLVLGPHDYGMEP